MAEIWLRSDFAHIFQCLIKLLVLVRSSASLCPSYHPACTMQPYNHCSVSSPLPVKPVTLFLEYAHLVSLWRSLSVVFKPLSLSNTAHFLCTAQICIFWKPPAISNDVGSCVFVNFLVYVGIWLTGLSACSGQRRWFLLPF